MPNNIITTPPLLDSTAQQIVRVIGSIADGGAFNQTTELPVASYFYVGKVIQYTGATTASLTHNYFYECVEDNGSYLWQQTNVQSDEGTSIIQIPSVVVGTYTYNGAAQGPDITGLDTTHCNVSNGTATDAGTYTLTISLKNPSTMVWSDLTNADKTYQYTISKADQVITSDKSSVTVDSEHLTATFEVTGNINGLTVSSDDTTVATVSEEDGTVTVSSVNETTGTAIISVYANSSANYNQSNTVQVSVTAQFIDPVLNNNDWATISEISAAGKAANIWAVGDCKEITLNGTCGTLALNNEKLCVFILGFNHNSAVEGTGITFGCFKTALTSGIDVCLDDAYYDSYKLDGTKAFSMNHWGKTKDPYNTNYGGWKGCDLRYDILGSTNQPPSGYGSIPMTSRVGYDATSTTTTSPVANTLMSCLPSDLRAVMKPITKYSDNTGQWSNVEANVTTSIDYLPLLAEYEVKGERSWANQYEYTNGKQAQYDYYKNGNSGIKRKKSSNTTSIYWWTRSAVYANETNFTTISPNNTTWYSHTTLGLSPVFLV